MGTEPGRKEGGVERRRFSCTVEPEPLLLKLPIEATLDIRLWTKG